jgi:hypothetical protein
MTDAPRIYARDYTDAEIDALPVGPLLTWLAWQAVLPVGDYGDRYSITAQEASDENPWWPKWDSQPRETFGHARVSTDPGAALAYWQRLCEAAPFGSYLRLTYDAKRGHVAQVYPPDALAAIEGASDAPPDAIASAGAKYAARAAGGRAMSAKTYAIRLAPGEWYTDAGRRYAKDIAMASRYTSPQAAQTMIHARPPEYVVSGRSIAERHPAARGGSRTTTAAPRVPHPAARGRRIPISPTSLLLNFPLALSLTPIALTLDPRQPPKHPRP